MKGKILVAADITTHPCLGGNNQCVMQYVEVLRKLDFDVYYLLICIRGMSHESVEATLGYWGDHGFYYRTPYWQDFLQRTYKHITRQAYPDNLDFYCPAGLIHYVNRLHTEYNFRGLIVNYIWQSKLAECKIPVKAIYTHDVFAYRDERIKAGSNWHHHSAGEEAKGIRRFEHILAIQDKERDYFSYLAPKKDVRAVYSGFDFSDQPVADNKNILFFSGRGDLNTDAIRLFFNNVCPHLLRLDKDIKLLIGGNICHELGSSELPENVVLMGRFDNPDDFYMLGDIAINPVFEGSGLKIKTFEAIAHGKVTIVNPHSAIGIFRPETAPLIMAQDADDYTSAIMKYIRKPERIGENKALCKKYIETLNAYIARQYYDIFSDSHQLRSF